MAIYSGLQDAFIERGIADYDGSSVAWLTEGRNRTDVFVATNLLAGVTGVFSVRDGCVCDEREPVEVSGTMLTVVNTTAHGVCALGVSPGLPHSFLMSAASGKRIPVAHEWMSELAPLSRATTADGGNHLVVWGAAGFGISHCNDLATCWFRSPDICLAVSLVHYPEPNMLLRLQLITKDERARLMLGDKTIATLSEHTEQMIAHVTAGGLLVFALAPLDVMEPLVCVHVSKDTNDSICSTTLTMPLVCENRSARMALDKESGQLWVAGTGRLLAFALDRPTHEPRVVWTARSSSNATAWLAVGIDATIAVGIYHVAMPVLGGDIIIVPKTTDDADRDLDEG